MQAHSLHEWQVTPAQAQLIQQRLAVLVSRENEITSPEFIAGVDISSPVTRGMATGAVVVLNYPQLSILEVEVAEQRVEFPYIPGLLSFRELPLIITVCQKLRITPDLILVDGQGIAHPRRLGIASHLGLLLNIPTIGCAKSILCGRYESLDEPLSSFAEIRDNGEVVGAALRTKLGTKPVYTSIGHKVDLLSAMSWVIKCCQGYRIPEPTRLAHLAASGRLSISQLQVQRGKIAA